MSRPASGESRLDVLRPRGERNQGRDQEEEHAQSVHHQTHAEVGAVEQTTSRPLLATSAASPARSSGAVVGLELHERTKHAWTQHDEQRRPAATGGPRLLVAAISTPRWIRLPRTSQMRLTERRREGPWDGVQPPRSVARVHVPAHVPHVPSTKSAPQIHGVADEQVLVLEAIRQDSHPPTSTGRPR